MFWLISSLCLIESHGKRDFYGILGLNHDCTEREIDRSFQKLSRKYHPDKNKGNEKAAEKFTDINDAYGTLKDSQKRRIYDLYGEDGVHVYERPKNELDDLFGMKAEDPNSMASKVNRRGKTYRIVFPVDLIDFYNSNHYDINVTRTTMCRCPTAGFFCPKCRGKATMRENVTLSLFVEKGSADGTVYTFKNAGDTTEANAAGDIEVEVVTKPHSVFRRSGSDLHISIPITLKEALTGFTRTIKNIDGSDVLVSTDKAIGTDRIVRVPGKGLPLYLYPGEFGDIVVHCLLRWPKNMSQDDKQKFADALTNC